MCSRLSHPRQYNPTTGSKDPNSNHRNGFLQRLNAMAARIRFTNPFALQPTYLMIPVKIPTQRLIVVARRTSTFLLCTLVALSVSITPLLQTQVARADTPDAPEEVMDVPDTFVDGPVSSFSISGTKLFWEGLAPVNCDPDVSTKSFDEFIRRKALQGSTIRTLFQERSEDHFCGPSITSNIVADSDNVYFVRGSLQVMPVLANPGDVLPKVNANVGGNAELLIIGANLYVLTEAKGLWRVDRQSLAATKILQAGDVGGTPTNFQGDGKYLYWLSGGRLKQLQIANNQLLLFGATDISNYTLFTSLCLIGSCTPTRFVYMGVGNQLRRFDANTRLFDSDIWEAGSDDRFDEMVVAGGNIFFVEEQATACAPGEFCGHNSLLFRFKIGLVNGSPELIYTGAGGINGYHGLFQLTANGNYLYWIDGKTPVSLKRLPQDASALPMTNLTVTNIEVTQAIQSLDNDVAIIQDKRTFVRVHVHSDDAGAPISGVTARLSRIDAPNGNVMGDPLIPENPSGAYLTISPDPERSVVDDSFLFELPMDWVDATGSPALYLRAEVNPYKSPPQASYAHNKKETSVFFVPSPKFGLRFVLFRFTVADQLFEADYDRDYKPTISWIRRAYPISSIPISIGQADPDVDSSPGFGPGYTFITDNDLKDYITQGECDFDDDMCASDYVHGLLEDWDDDWQFDYAMMYGMMPEYTSPYSGDFFFPRGSTSGDTSNGPSGIPGGSWDWDVDGTYADWYAGHEIGHLLGRDHPSKNGDPDPGDNTKVGCGQSQDDDDYPYSKAHIDNDKYFGFDTGDPQISGDEIPNVYPGSGAFDVMSYCHPIEWVSDYTYHGLYTGMFDATAVQAAALNSPQATGDYLYLSGVVKPAEAKGHIVRVRRKSGAFTPPTPSTTDYAIKMLDADGGTLATVDVPLAPDPENKQRLLLQVDLPWTSGTRTVQLIHKPDSQIYITHTFSANPPVVSNVTVSPLTNPVTGTITLSWDASDADGDSLTYDIHYSIDNGASFQPLQANLNTPSTQINTLELGGSTQALLRVTAFDGGNTTTATSAPFVLANKPPVVDINNPQDGIHVAYGQLINFIGDAQDPQWGAFAKADLKWSSEDGPLGTGAALPITNLQVGVHTITFSAKNSAGLQASKSITVYVDDDLALPGPTLQVAPKQLGWHFDIGDTTPQTATLAIANIGSGSFDWVASSPAPWLTFSSNQGISPAEIIVTADPTQMPAVDSISSTITVSATIGAGQFSFNVGAAAVPAHAVFGNSMVIELQGHEPLEGQEPAFPTQLYLPTTRK